MTDLLTKGGRAWALAALLLLTVTAGGAVAQTYGKRKDPKSTIGVAKKAGVTFEDANFSSIQAAVNAAKAGDIIEILDEEIYDEQVTIDGRATSPWPGVTGGKNGITIKYIPTATNKAFGNHARPTIKYQDKTNNHPRNSTEAKSDDELTGSGNFETCGALRVLRAKNITIEGIAVDGGGAYAFGYEGVWCPAGGGNCSPLFHGNAAITLAVATRVTVRDCDLKGAYFGINVKDRNTGGVFANQNPSDPDAPTPLSGFDEVGLHLFEYNKIHGNVVGFFFESAWNMGSTVRYNLIYNNKVNKTLTAGKPEENNQNGGAIMFKDMFLSPVAIYNNTFYDNTGNFLGNWQVGGQHLIFNNIFSKSSSANNPGNDHMSLDGKFPFRMNNCVFSTDLEYIQVQNQNQFNCDNPQAPGGNFVDAVRFQGSGFANPTKTPVELRACNGNGGTFSGTSRQNMTLPGALIEGTTGEKAVTFAPDANIRWMQMEGFTKSGYTQPSLFKSLTETSADFLVPKWDSLYVKDYIQNKGWAAADIRNSDGKLADLGAIPSDGVKQSTVARITPTSVVLLNGANATANFKLIEDVGKITGSKIKLLRWVAPVPLNTKNEAFTPPNADPTGETARTNEDWPDKVVPIRKDAINAISSTAAVNVGTNSLTFATGGGAVPLYGFFEILVQGTDSKGNTVTSDVGFLPYRKLEYEFVITVHETASSPAITTVEAGKTYIVRVTKKCPASGTCPSTIDEVAYSLLSGSAFMRFANGDTLSEDKNVAMPKDYSVYFSKAGSETIFASGVSKVTVGGKLTSLVFVGTKDIIVKPGDPARVEFKDPVALGQIGTDNQFPPTINMGRDQEVIVEVQDKYGNAVDKTGVVVTIPEPVAAKQHYNPAKDCPSCGDVRSRTATVDPATGQAKFTAYTKPGATQTMTFDLVATLPGVTQSDNMNVGRLRIGRSLEVIKIFYEGDAGWATTASAEQNDESKIVGELGDKFKVVAKVVIGTDVKTDYPDRWVSVEGDDPDLVFSATENGTYSSAAVFDLKGGIAEFWISTKDGVNRDIPQTGYTSITVRVWSDQSGTVDGGVTAANRENIRFTKKDVLINYGVVYGDGEGRPESVRVYYKAGTKLTSPGQLTSKVSLVWGGDTLVATGAAITALNDTTLVATFGGTRPTGYTSIKGFGQGIVILAGVGGQGDDAGFDVYDGVGPVLGNGGSKDGAGGAPKVYSNDDGNAVDTLEVYVSEALRSVGGAVTWSTIMYSPPGTTPTGATLGTALRVLSVSELSASGNGKFYKIVVERSGGVGPEENGWIRLNPTGDAADEAADQSLGNVSDNKPHAENRWVQLELKALDPGIVTAFYTGDDVVGKPNYVYVKYNRKVNASEWFAGGKVSFAGSASVTLPDDAAVLAEYLTVVGTDTLRIDLSKTSSFTGEKAAVRTGGAMDFTLSYNRATGWEDITSSAKDRAAPVMARTAVLKTGSISADESEFYRDTLIVYYSEPLNEGSKAETLNKPLTLKAKGGMGDRYGIDFQPELRLLDFGYDRDAGYYKARYLAYNGWFGGVDDKANKPVTGDSVHIFEPADIGDDITPPNLQKNKDNKWVMLKVESTVKWTVRVKSNPFVSGDGSGRGVGVELSPNLQESDMKVTAEIQLFDNTGALVVRDTVTGARSVEWRWDGTNSKGRLVGTGTYLFRAKCTSDAGGDIKKESFERVLGVVRGKR